MVQVSERGDGKACSVQDDCRRLRVHNFTAYQSVMPRHVITSLSRDHVVLLLLTLPAYCAQRGSVMYTGYTDIGKFAGYLPHRYGSSRAIWDHTVLPATRQR